MKYLKIAVIIPAIAFVVIQFFRPDFTNPPVVEGENLFAGNQVPDDVKAVLKRSCADCHSNETVYPWYSKISPSSWFLVGHIEEGRRELNFSNFNAYETRRKIRKLDEVCEQIEQGEMPLSSYLWIHWSAKLSAEEKKLLCDWTTQEKQKLSAAQ